MRSSASFLPTDEIPWFLAILIRYALPLSLGTKSSAAKTAADTVKNGRPFQQFSQHGRIPNSEYVLKFGRQYNPNCPPDRKNIMDNHAEAHWQNGWLQSIRHTPSPNFSPREKKRFPLLCCTTFRCRRSNMVRMRLRGFCQSPRPGRTPVFRIDTHFARIQPFLNQTRRQNGTVRFLRQYGIPC